MGDAGWVQSRSPCNRCNCNGRVACTAVGDYLEHSSLYRAMALLQRAGGCLQKDCAGGGQERTALADSELAALMGHLTYNSTKLRQVGIPMPHRIFLPLLEIGVSPVLQLREGRRFGRIAQLEQTSTLEVAAGQSDQVVQQALLAGAALVGHNRTQSHPTVFD